MIKLTPILLESYEIYQFSAMIKSYKSENKSVILNKIRAVPYVIRVKVQEDPRLAGINKQYDYEYSIIKIKYLNVFGVPTKAIKHIKNTILNGNKVMHKIDGVIDFKPLNNTLHKIDGYG